MKRLLILLMLGLAACTGSEYAAHPSHDFAAFENVYDVLKRKGAVVYGNQLSIRGSHKPPLVVLDGQKLLPGSDLSFINLFDVESIAILSSGEATLYGPETAAGVIVIRTKRR